jgi:hypothetical protein
VILGLCQIWGTMVEGIRLTITVLGNRNSFTQDGRVVKGKQCSLENLRIKLGIINNAVQIVAEQKSYLISQLNLKMTLVQSQLMSRYERLGPLIT